MGLDETAQRMRDEEEQLLGQQQRRNTRRRGLLGLTACAALVIMLLLSPVDYVSLPKLRMPCSDMHMHLDSAAEDQETAHSSNALVPLEAHIMSKCPDARDCLRDLVLPTMQRVVDKVNFTLSYIGKPTQDGVECMHGPGECMGNILELCAARLYPDPKRYLGFTMCLSFDYPQIPARSLVEDCALEHAIDIEALNTCATQDDGEFALDLLRDSVQHSAAVGVTKSCTVRLDNQIYCIRDGGQWKDCPAGPGVNDLVLAVEKLYRQG